MFEADIVARPAAAPEQQGLAENRSYEREPREQRDTADTREAPKKRGLSSRADDLEDEATTPRIAERQSFAPRNLRTIDIDKDAKAIGSLLNNGRSDLAVSALSRDLMNLEGDDYNRLLVKVSQEETPEIEGDDSGHLLLSDWNTNTGTWDHVYVSEGDQLYRFVQPGNTLERIAADRLGNGNPDAVARYVKNISDVNHIPAPELIRRGQALRLPYPS